MKNLYSPSIIDMFLIVMLGSACSQKANPQASNKRSVSYGDSGSQVWGAENGGYIFDRTEAPAAR